MATTAPAGDPTLSQDAAPAALAWQNRPTRVPQFTSLSDADAAAGALPNPGAPPISQGPAQDLPSPTPAPAPTQYQGFDPGRIDQAHVNAPAAPVTHGADYGQPAPAPAPAPAPQAPTTRLASIEPGDNASPAPYQRPSAPPSAGAYGGTQRPSGPRYQHFLNPQGDASRPAPSAFGTPTTSSFAAPAPGTDSDPNNRY